MSFWTAGIAYDEVDGAIHVLPDGVIATHCNGLPIAADGALVVSFDQTPVQWVAGIPLDADGRVCLATPSPPFDLKAFSGAFAPAEFT
jgi:hypothetical protein